jgi:hypothetical protein
MIDSTKPRDLLAAISLLAVLLFSVHIADDFVLGFDKGVVNNSYGILIFVVWLCGVVFFRERLVGRIILLLGGILSLGVAVLHLRGRGYGEAFVQAPAAFRFIWTLYALGIAGSFIILLSLRELVARRGATRT